MLLVLGSSVTTGWEYILLLALLHSQPVVYFRHVHTEHSIVKGLLCMSYRMIIPA